MTATARPLSRSKGRRFIGSGPLRFQGVDDAVSGNRGDQPGKRAPLFCSSGRMRPVSTSMIQSCRYPERSDTKAIWRLSGAQVGSSFRPTEVGCRTARVRDRKSTRLNSSHGYISYAVFCLKKKKKKIKQ